jgi:putative nucleotidyltransferase with HDIG domain
VPTAAQDETSVETSHEDRASRDAGTGPTGSAGVAAAPPDAAAPEGVRPCLALVLVAGILIVIDAALVVDSTPGGYRWLVLVALTWGSGLFSFKVPGVPLRLSASEVFVFLQLLLFGGPAAVLTVASDGLLSSILRRDGRVIRVLFNVAEPAVSVWLAAQVFVLAGGHAQYAVDHTPLSELAGPTVAVGLVYFLANSGLTAIAVWGDTGRSPFEVWRQHLAWVSLNYFASASIALLLLHDARDVSFDSVSIAVPLVLTVYLAFRAGIRRIDGEHRHLEKLNRLYLATVESLATAIDAKDLTTSSHIRRVRALSLQLARAMGITDTGELQALEAAALLHDVGKLAVPDHVLKKPGGLSEAELALIRQHPVVGAQILGAVDFPFPVAPIVRHHHESWDGSGYPDALSGLDIPLGARILAVIDCYDALTSHRPYRRALGHDEAMVIVRGRAGTMYDPEVVSAFERLAPMSSASDEENPAPWTAEVALAATGDASGPAAAASGGETCLAAWCAEVAAVADRLSLQHVAALVADQMCRASAARLALVGIVDQQAACVRVVRACGPGADRVEGLSIPMGEGMMGWVAVHGTTIVNSDPALDVGDRLAGAGPALRSALAVRLAMGGTVVGVVMICAEAQAAFVERDRLRIEHAADTMAAALASARAGRLLERRVA